MFSGDPGLYLLDAANTHHARMTTKSVSSFSCVRLFVIPWTVTHLAPLSMEFSRQEHWSRLSCFPPGDRSDPGIKPRSPVLQADSLLFEPPGKSLKMSPRGAKCYLGVELGMNALE